MITPAPEGSVALAPAAAETLPTWDLSDLYESPESPRIEADLARAEADARAFSASHAGKLAALSGRELAVAMECYQAIDEILGRVMSYAQLLFSADSTDAAAGRFYQVMMERCTSIFRAHAVFSPGTEPHRGFGAGGKIRRSGLRALAPLSARFAGVAKTPAFR